MHIYINRPIRIFVFSIMSIIATGTALSAAAEASDYYFGKEAKAKRRLKAISSSVDRWQNKVDHYYNQHIQATQTLSQPQRSAYDPDNIDTKTRTELEKTTRNANFNMSEDYSRETLSYKLSPKHKVDISSQTFYTRYEEPKIMKQRGIMKGVEGSYTYRPEKDDLLNTPIVNTYRAEGMYAEGEFQYESEAPSQTGLRIDKDDHMYEARGLLGKEYAAGNNLYMLYSGFGFRYLSDDDDGSLINVPGIGNFWNYKRVSRYYYVPAGLRVTNHLDDKSRLILNMEYAHLIKGKQHSRFSDGNNIVCCNEDAWNNQNKGYGLRGSLQYERDYWMFRFSLEPFIRYWHIEDSDIETVQIHPALGGPTFTGLEPENKTFETGAKFSLIF